MFVNLCNVLKKFSWIYFPNKTLGSILGIIEIALENFYQYVYLFAKPFIFLSVLLILTFYNYRTTKQVFDSSTGVLTGGLGV